LPRSYFGLGPSNTQLDFAVHFIGMVRWANSLGSTIDAGATVLQQFGASEIGRRADMSKGEVSSVTNGEVS
jgi:hypothetical protein